MGKVRVKPLFSAPKLLGLVRACFEKIQDHRLKKPKISLGDALMSGLAVFGLKYSLLLKFDEGRQEAVVRANLTSLYGVEIAPCDTQLRTILDAVKPEALRGAYRVVHQQLQDHGVYEQYEYFEGHHLVLLDGTGHFGSGKVCCAECCVKKTKQGEAVYYHQLLGAVCAHPDQKQVLPFAPEAITRRDGESKNDCEREASKRLLRRLKQEYPQLKAVIVEDSLSGNGPHIKLLKELGYRFIIGVKEGDHEGLFEQVHEKLMGGEMEEFEEIDEAGISRGFRFVNGLELNKTHPDTVVNYLDYWEIHPTGKTLNFTWITDLELTRERVYAVMRAGRSRWKIENETYNTLKNLGYQLEHNYGHGQQHLATVLGFLCVLAFLIDQVQAFGCCLFQQARQRFRSNTSLWEKMRAFFTSFYIPDWDTLWQAIIHRHARYELQPLAYDTS
jgi:hypothetical protein